MGLSAFERETVISFSDAEPIASVYSAQRRVITKLTKNESARLLESGSFEGSPWARFELPKSFVSFRSKARKLSVDEATRRTARLQAANVSVLDENGDPDRGNQ